MPASLRSVLHRSGWVQYRPIGVLKKEAEDRAIFMSPDVSRVVDPSKTRLNQSQVAGVIARLNRFVYGKPITVSTPLVGNQYGDIKALKERHKRLFAVRFFDVAPQLRMLGVFPQKDVFLACKLVARSDLDDSWQEMFQKLERQINAMGKDAPQCLTYEKMDEVLSNWTISK